MKLKTFNDLFFKLFLELQFIGNLVLNLYPKMNAKVSSQELKDLLELHMSEIRLELIRIEKILKDINVKTAITEEDPTKSIFTNAEKLIRENNISPILDAAIISLVQQIEHLEAATYSSLEAYADALDLSDIKTFLDESLRKVHKVDETLETLEKRRFFSPSPVSRET
jgi:ferritin-like metal-binding protein YciE